MATIDIEQIQTMFKDVVDGVRDSVIDLEPEDREQVDKNSDQICKLIQSFVDIFGDGLQWTDFSKIGSIIAPLMTLAASFKDYRGKDKKRFVSEVMWLIYRVVDTYPNGNGNNINLPFVFGTFERKLERYMITFATEMAIESLYSRMKASGEL